MVHAIRHYLVRCVATAASCGLVVGLLQGLRNGDGMSGAVVGLGAGLVFGLLLSLVLGASEVAGDRRAGGTNRRVGPRSSVAFVVAAELPTVTEQAMGALRDLPAELTQSTETVLEARTGITWRSFGEVVRVELARVPAGTNVRVSTRPRVPTTLFDYGSGRRRVDAVLDALRSSFPVVDAADGQDPSAHGPTESAQPWG